MKIAAEIMVVIGMSVVAWVVGYVEGVREARSHETSVPPCVPVAGRVVCYGGQH